MALLSDGEMAQIRADVAETLVDSCVIQRGTTSKDDYGNVSTAWNAVGTVICRLEPLNGRNGVVADREIARNHYVLYVGWDEDVRDGDRVVIAGDTYEIVALHDDHSLRSLRHVQVVRFQEA